MKHTTRTDTPNATACATDCGRCDDCSEADHWVAAPCHCPTCDEAARLDPGSTFVLRGLARDGGER